MLDAEIIGPLGNARYLEYVGVIRDSGIQLSSLVNDVLEFSRGAADQLLLCEDEFALADVIDEALDVVARQAKAGKIRLSADMASGGVCLRADRQRIHKVLVSLLANAIKFTNPGGRVAVHTRRVADGCAIAVSDTGIGIAQEDIPKALEPFGQVDSDLTRKYAGTGLGLPLAKQCMDLHGGLLEIDSTVHVGTIVTAIFPAERVVTWVPVLSVSVGEKSPHRSGRSV
jgi:signal transduction histidine kinase